MFSSRYTSVMRFTTVDLCNSILMKRNHIRPLCRDFFTDNPYHYKHNCFTMNTYDKIKTDADEASDGAMRYFELQGERLKLELIERLTVSLSDLLHALIVGVFVLVGIFMVCVVFGLFVQQFADNWIISAICASVFFGAMTWIVVTRGREMIRNVITKILIRSIYE